MIKTLNISIETSSGAPIPSWAVKEADGTAYYYTGNTLTHERVVPGEIEVRLGPTNLKPYITGIDYGDSGLQGQIKGVEQLENLESYLALSPVKDGKLNEFGKFFTGGAGRTYFDEDGLLKKTLANEPRTTYIGGNPYLWIDGSVTEISGQSFDVDNWSGNNAAVVKNATGMDGQANTAFTVTDSSNTAAQFAFRSFPIANDASDYYIVAAIKKNDAPTVYPSLRADVSGGTTPVREIICFDPSDGSYVEIFSQGRVEIEPFLIGDFWFVVLGVTNNSSGNTSSSLLFRPAYNTNGTATLDNTAQGSGVIAYYGAFKDNFSLMPILTTGGTTATVAADVASLTNSIISNMTEGTIYAEVWSPQKTSNSVRYVASLRDSLNDRVDFRYDGAGNHQVLINDDGVSQASFTTTPISSGVIDKVALAFKEDSFALYVNGSQEGSDSSGTVPTITNLFIGSDATPGNFLYGGIKTLNVYTSRPPNSQLASMTTP